MIRDRYDHPNFGLVRLGSLTTLVQYGTSRRSTSEGGGVPVLRIPNLQADGWDLSDLKYLPLSAEELATYRLEDGDILFNRTNGSRDLVGKCEVFDFEGDWVFASYLIRLRLDTERAIPQFVTAFLNTYWGRRQVEHVSRQILMSNINTEEIRALRIPLPELPKQRDLLATLEAARTTQLRKLKEADDLLDSLDKYTLESLGLKLPPPHDPHKPFAVRLSKVRGGRLDPPANTPFPIPSNPRRIPIKALSNVAAINSNTAPTQRDQSTIVPYVGLPECNQNDVREVASRTYKEVRGRSVARVGDILFARIEPSIFNKKYIFVEQLDGHDYAFLSTEFYTVRAHGNEDDQKYLYAMFQSSFVFNQVRGKTTGSSGRRRLDPDLFASLLIPWPKSELRKAIAAEVFRRRKAASRLRKDAAKLWDGAKRSFEEALLGTVKPSTSRGEHK